MLWRELGICSVRELSGERYSESGESDGVPRSLSSVGESLGRVGLRHPLVKSVVPKPAKTVRRFIYACFQLLK